MPGPELSFIDVCAAVIVEKGALLLAKRGPATHLAGHWEFPGGKVREGENLADCIKREIREELDGEVYRSRHLRTIEHHYPEKAIRLHFLSCRISENCKMRALEHEAIGWYTPEEADRLLLAPADRKFLDWYCRNDRKI